MIFGKMNYTPYIVRSLFTVTHEYGISLNDVMFVRGERIKTYVYTYMYVFSFCFKKKFGKQQKK